MSFNIPVFISVKNVVAGLIDKLLDARRDAMAVFLSSNSVVETFMSDVPSVPFAVTSNAQSFSVFSGTTIVFVLFAMVSNLFADTASVRAVAFSPDSGVRFDIIVFTVNLSFGATNDGADTDIMTGD